jgi:hypothetical protein
MPTGRPKKGEQRGYNGNDLLKRPKTSIDWTEDLIHEYTRCSVDVKYFIEKYVRIINMDEGLMEFKLRPYQETIIDSFNDNRHVILLIGRQSGKALDLNTPVLTSSGWSTIGNIKIGDKLYGNDGRLTNVTNITEIMHNHSCYEIEFDNGEKIVADEEHLWNVGSSEWKTNKILNTKEIIVNKENFLKSKQSLYVDYITNPLEFEEQDVLIDPYTLGLWLGDGNSADSRISCHIDDFQSYKTNIDIEKFVVDSRNANIIRFKPRNLSVNLKKLNLIKNKHIPSEYLFNSVERRLELLRGLMDSDGYSNKKGNCEFYQKSKQFIDDVRFLLTSLGIKTSIKNKNINGETYYTLRFTTSEFDVFKLERKLQRSKNNLNHFKNKRIYIKNIRRADSVPVRCLQVDNEDKLFLVGNTLIPTHNSTITVGFALHQILFNSYFSIFLLAQNGDMAKELLNKVKLSYENLPLWLQQGIVKWDAHAIWLENGSKIHARATSKNAVRGRSANLILCDELAFVENGMADEFFASTWPTISSGKKTKFFALSTPNGYNLFHKLWVGAEKNTNGFKPIKVHWSEVPGRDEEWKKQEIATFGQEMFDREYECSFDSSSNGLIAAAKIKELMDNSDEPLQKDDDDCLYIYEKPKEGEKYIIVVDTAKGVEKDYSAFAVIKISKLPYEVVAVYRNNKISPLVYPDVLYKVGINYNEADMLIENNEYGQQITTILFFEKEYGNLIFTELTNKKQRIAYGNDGKAVAGVRTTAGIKNIGCSNLKAMIEHNKLIVRDYNTISELSTFIRVKDSYEADQGSHDDLVMCLVLFGWLSTQDYFKDIEQNVGEDIRSMHESDIDANMIGFGFMTNGKQSDDYYSDEEDTDHKDGWRPAGYEDNDEFEISIYY